MNAQLAVAQKLEQLGRAVPRSPYRVCWTGALIPPADPGFPTGKEGPRVSFGGESTLRCTPNAVSAVAKSQVRNRQKRGHRSDPSVKLTVDYLDRCLISYVDQSQSKSTFVAVRRIRFRGLLLRIALHDLLSPRSRRDRGPQSAVDAGYRFVSICSTSLRNLANAASDPPRK